MEVDPPTALPFQEHASYPNNPDLVKSYKVVARPDIRLAAHGLQPLNEDVLVQALEGAVVREVGETQWGLRVVDVQLRRPSDAEALDEIVSVLEQLGFSLVEATVSEWVREGFERAIAWAFGGFVLGGGISENLLIGLAAFAVGGIAAQWVGAEGHRLEAQFEAQRDHRGVWVYREIPGQPVSAPALRPGFSPA